MLGLGFGEILIVAVVLLVAVGPKRLPTLMRSLGRAMREFRRSAFELRQASGIDRMLDPDFESVRKPRKAPVLPAQDASPNQEPLSVRPTAKTLMQGTHPQEGTEETPAPDNSVIETPIAHEKPMAPDRHQAATRKDLP